MSSVLIIAEAGVNHNGSIELAKQLIDVAALAGVDIVKFQTFKAEKLVTKTAKKADYQVTNTKNEESQFAMLKKLELSYEDHLVLIEYCKQKNIRFLSTAFDMESLEMLSSFGIDIYKIPSGEITNYPYLKKISGYNKQVIVSTGMCSMQEIKDAFDVLVKFGTDPKNIKVLHCNTEYPTPMKDVNLLAMNSIKNMLGVEVGYSDHTLGIEVSVAAVALGATVIEKHFTLDKTMEGPDHLASLDPKELKQMVSAIRNIEMALGSGIKQPSESEIKNRAIARKSIHLSKDLKKGHIVTESDLIMKRPGDGISPMKMENVVGKKLMVDLLSESKLRIEDLE